MLSIVGLLSGCRGESFGLVGTLGTPRDIVPVAERVDVENVDVRRHDEQVLGEGSEHVPWVQVEERSDIVQTKGGSEGDDDDTGASAAEERLDKGAGGATVQLLGRRVRECANDKVHGEDNDVELDEAKDDERGHVTPSGTLGTVTQRENELKKQEREVEVLQDGVENRSDIVAEWPSALKNGSLGIVRVGWSTDKVHDDRGGEPERGESKPGEEDLGDVVKHLDVEEEHADQVVATLVHTTEMHEGVDTGCEGTVQPTSTLANEFGGTFGHVGFTLGSLDVGQMPFGACLGDQFEAKNTIFGQEHVLLEDVHALNTLLAENLGQGVVTVEILLERPTHDGTVSVGRESTRQHADVSEGTLQRLVENVTDLVLEVLGGDERVQEVLPALV